MKKILIILSTSIAMTGCGNKKNPTQDYPAKAVPPHEMQVRDQLVDSCPTIINDAFAVVEGKSIREEIKVVGANSTDDLLISGDSTILVEKKGSNYFLNYSAPKGLVEIGKPPVEIPFSLVIQSKDKPKNVEQLKRCAKPMKIFVIRSYSMPIITKISVPKNINVDSSQMATGLAEITVADSSIEDIDLSFKFDRTTKTAELPMWDLTQAITNISAPERIKENVYQIRFQIDPAVIKHILRNEAGGKRDMVTQVRAFNVRSQLVSPSKNLETIAILPEAPKRGRK